MRRWTGLTVLIAIAVGGAVARANVAAATGPEKGTLLLCSFGSADIRARFVALAGGAEAKIVIVLNRIPPGADAAAARASAARGWAAWEVTAWCAEDRKGAEAGPLLDALRGATGVWFTGGRPQLYTESYVGSAAQRELAAVLARGGVVGGESAGAMIQSNFLALPPSPQPDVTLKGFGFVRNVAVFPHFNGESGKFPLATCEKTVVAHPGLVGLAIRDGAAVIVRGADVEVLGKGDVTVLRATEAGRVTATPHAAGEHFTLSGASVK
jgi:cyanophycinase